MAVQWSTEYVVAEHRELQASTMAVDSKGQLALLAGRKYLALVKLDRPTEVVKILSRQSKWEVTTAEWNPHSSHAHIFALACNQRADLVAWHDGTMSSIQTLKAHTRVIGDLNWSPFDPNLLATCSVDNYMYIWDIRDARRPATSFSTIAGASQVKWNKVTDHLLATANEGDVRLWDHRMRIRSSPVSYLTAHTKKILGLDWSPIHENQLATASQECTVKFWDISRSNKIENTQTLNSAFPVWRARYTPFGEGLITVVVPQLRRGENSLFLWNNSNLMTPVHTFVGHTDVVLEFAWRPQKEDTKDFQLVTWAKDYILRIWKIDSQMQKLCGHDIDYLESSDQDIPPASELQETTDSFNQLLTTVEKSSKLIPNTDAAPQERLMAKSDLIDQATPKTIEQEFSLVNINIPNVTVEEMDSKSRTCTVLVVSGNNSVELQMNFPIGYPLNYPPTFQFCKGTTVDNSIKNKLLKSLRTTSQQHVKRNRTCLEPCLRQLKSALDEACLVNTLNSEQERSESSASFVIDGAGAVAYLPGTNRYGSFQDVTVPFPRTSGASFCGTDYLVCFSRPIHMKRMSNPGEITPRSLSALVAYTSTNIHSKQPNLMYPTITQSPSADGSVSVSSYYYQDRKFRGKSKPKDGSESHSSNQKLSKAGRVVIYSIAALMPIHKELAQNYSLNVKNIQNMCLVNSNAAAVIGRKDLVQLWSLISLSMSPTLTACPDPDAGFPWPQHPFGRKMLQSLMDHYIKIRDIQTVAMICSIFGNKQEKPAPSRKISHCGIADTAVYTHLSGKWWSKPGGSPYHTIHPGDTNLENWNIVLLKTSRSNSWSDSLDDHEYKFNSMLESQDSIDRDRHENNIRFLDPKHIHQYDEFKCAYAELLHRWDLLNHRAEILKLVSSNLDHQKSVEFLKACRFCHNEMKGAFCNHCKKYGFRCAICHISVKGASNFCLACGHGGHAQHMLQWFYENNYCPVGCGCNCLQESDIFG